MTAAGWLVDYKKFILFEYSRSMKRTGQAAAQDPEKWYGAIPIHIFKESPKFGLLFLTTDQIKKFFSGSRKLGAMRSLVHGLAWPATVPIRLYKTAKWIVSPAIQAGGATLK